MKLVNPQGRMVDDITNQANSGCACSTNTYLQSNARANITVGCTCQCSYGSDNNSANHNIGAAK